MISKLTIAFLVFSLVLPIAAVVQWYPREWGVIPEWKLQLVDEAGHPVVGVNVNQEWYDPIEEGMTLVDIERTDSNGFVVFPRHVLRRQAEQGPPEFQLGAHISACGQGLFGQIIWYERDGQVPVRLQLTKGSCPYG